MSRPPWAILYDCNTDNVPCKTPDCLPEAGERCKSEGILPDIVNLMAERYNFTWYTDNSNRWGLGLGDLEDPSSRFTGILVRIDLLQLSFANLNQLELSLSV